VCIKWITIPFYIIPLVVFKILHHEAVVEGDYLARGFRSDNGFLDGSFEQVFHSAMHFGG